MKLLKTEFDCEPVHGEDNDYIKTKIKIYTGSMITNFESKKMPKKKSTMPMFINNNARFCYQSQEKVLSSNTLRRM